VPIHNVTSSLCFLILLLQGVTPSKRRAIYFSTAKTLAAIHKVDVNAIGLQKYGRRDNYCKRQVGSNYSYFVHVDSL
jgi:aminoglycoside phosphotransferase (APT) family kinase protein